MENFKKSRNTPEEAEAFLKTISDCFQDADLHDKFTAAFITAQAAMVDWLIKETHFTFVQREIYLGGVFRDKSSQIEMATAWDNYNHASIEFQIAKRNLQEILKNPLAKLSRNSIESIKK